MAALQGRRLLLPLPLLAQQALRRAVPPPVPRCRFLGSSFPPAAPASASPPAPAPRPPSGSLLPTSAVPAARGAGSLGLEISALQRGRTTSGWPLPSSALLHAAAPWVLWTSAAADDMVLMLIGANVSVFMLWRVLAYPSFITDPHMVRLDMYLGGRLHTLLTSAYSNVDPMFMRKHFMISLDNFTSGRLHTLLTGAFSHKDLKHLFNNMVGLYFFGSSGQSRVSGSAHLGGALVAAVAFAKIKGRI